MLSSENIKQQSQINQTDIATFCSLLTVSQQLDIFSMLLTLSAVIMGLLSDLLHFSWFMSSTCLVVFLLGIVTKYYAVRIAFDKKLFDYLTNHLDQVPDVLNELDQALLKLHLIKLVRTPVRTIKQRQIGTLGLFKVQLIVLAIQLLLVVGVLISIIICR
ncbi:hypothetical protein [Gilliamella sp. B2838]|uniref:hypothetical protein n=1 Tax=Gilliamella sp. B2838 TaxID=2818020 RepID=UPI0022697E68|nr:hypothetical protein [Gilliamella sp. B2838]MCX8727470.1 hypothetical protein [Gilliamella sp. B2838]